MNPTLQAKENVLQWVNFTREHGASGGELNCNIDCIGTSSLYISACMDELKTHGYKVISHSAQIYGMSPDGKPQIRHLSLLIRPIDDEAPVPKIILPGR
jgi:hypothetical protein